MLAIALVALGLFTVRPFCDVAFAGSAQGAAELTVAQTPQGIESHRHPAEMPATACCASIEDGTLAAYADPLVSWTPGDASGALAIAAAGVLRAESSRESARIALAALPERSYYARSARIQR